MKITCRKLLVSLTFMLVGLFTQAQIVLNEILVNPPGSDDPFEFIEVKGTPGTTINNIYLCVFEGDSASAGNCDLSIPLNNLTFGSNGLILVGSSLGYPNIPSETVFKDTLLFGIPGGYLENGSTTFALIFSSVNMVEDADYDFNNDGTLDLPLGAVMLDAVGWTNGDPYAVIYGGVVLTQSAGTPDAAVRFYGNSTPFSKPAWYNGDITSLAQFDPLEISDNLPVGAGLTPGNHNVPNGGVGFYKLTEKAIEVFPNPASEIIHVRSGDLNPIQVSLLNSSGLLIRSEQGTKQVTIDLSDIASGIYFLQVRDQSTTSNRKISVIH